MLQIIIPAIEEDYDELENKFIYSKEQVLQLEHSLVSLSKWESKFCKPFLTKVDKTPEESLEYIRCMTITQNVPESAYKHLTQENLDSVVAYISAPMTATTFSNNNHEINRDIITAEIIYYWMITLNIPFECQKWHLNRLLTLINVCNIKNNPPSKKKKKTPQEIYAENRAINEARKLQLGSSG